MAMWWQPWVTPAIVIAGLTAMSVYLETRFASVDRRFDTLANEIAQQRDRADRVIETLGDVRADVAAVRTDLANVGARVERIATHLQVTEAPDPSPIQAQESWPDDDADPNDGGPQEASDEDGPEARQIEMVPLEQE